MSLHVQIFVQWPNHMSFPYGQVTAKIGLFISESEQMNTLKKLSEQQTSLSYSNRSCRVYIVLLGEKVLELLSSQYNFSTF